MMYICVRWHHDFCNEPVLLYSELNDNRMEVRKIEVYSDGRIGYASPSQAVGSTRLGLEPIPELAEIACDPQFELEEITREDFEEVWADRCSTGT